jgi:UPF0755 protein
MVIGVKKIIILTLLLIILVGCEDIRRMRAPTLPPGPVSEAPQPHPNTMKITVPEGFTLPRIGMMLEEKGIASAHEFVAATQNGDFNDFTMIAQLPYDPGRCFLLEGYLYPDTYEIYLDEPLDSIIRRMLSNAQTRYGHVFAENPNQTGYTMDEIITIASIIEKEAFGPEQMPMISSVLHNRLNIGMKLQCDVTIHYIRGVIYPFSTDENPERFWDIYDTYTCPALPPGAICNPSSAAVRAALNPAASSYLFFVTDDYLDFYYSETYEEHLANIAIAEAKNELKRLEEEAGTAG